MHVGALADAGVALWALREDRLARRFHERLGGTPVAEREAAPGEDTRLSEIAYVWADLVSLDGRAKRARGHP